MIRAYIVDENEVDLFMTWMDQAPRKKEILGIVNIPGNAALIKKMQTSSFMVTAVKHMLNPARGKANSLGAERHTLLVYVKKIVEPYHE